MPLSEEELKLLEQMERALVEEDPKFASTLRGTSLRRAARRRAVAAGAGFAVGVAVLMTGAITKTVVVGVVGFVVMLATATIALAALRGQHQVGAAAEAEPEGEAGFTVIEGGRARSKGSRKPRTPKTRPSRGGSTGSSGSFMDRMEQRWRRRREGNGF